MLAAHFDKKFSRRQERQLVRLGRQLMMTAHPNPERVGCPDRTVLKEAALELRTLPREEFEGLLDHTTICSPCFREYYGYRRQFRIRQRLPLMAAAAVLVIVAGVATQRFLSDSPSMVAGREPAGEQRSLVPYQEIRLDLRSRSPLRSEVEEDASVSQEVLRLPRGRLALSVLLPLGSDEGEYTVRLVSRARQSVVTAKGGTEVRNRVLTLRVQLDTSALLPGDYRLEIREEPWPWMSYPLALE